MKFKYNRSEIFKNAWNFFKANYSPLFGDCLSRAWADAKKARVFRGKDGTMIKLGETHQEMVMHYGEYKQFFQQCKTKHNSYNQETKEITVYVSKFDILLKERDVLREKVIWDISNLHNRHRDISREATEQLEKSAYAVFNKAHTEKAMEKLLKSKMFEEENLVNVARNIMAALAANA